MTQEDKRQKIGAGVLRLTEIRDALIVARGERDAALKALELIGKKIATPDDQIPVPNGDEWKSPAEVRDLMLKVSKLVREAQEIINELHGIDGVDANLFKLNGD